MKTAQCIPMPRFRSSCRTVTTPVSLLERLREVVLRLIMLSAISKGARAAHRRREQSSTAAGGGGGCGPAQHRNPDAYRSEAVDDCIEFFKRSSTGISEDGAKSSSAASEDISPQEFLKRSSVLPVL